MKRSARQQGILEQLIEAGRVDLDSLTEQFDVSRMTIHRDLDELESEGVLRKVRGGATIEPSVQFESDFRIRANQGIGAKQRMARAALSLIEPGMIVIINDGSMAAVLGERIVERTPVTVITNNAAIVASLQNTAGVTLIVLGGTYTPKFNAFVGRLTLSTLQQVRADLAFISSPAVSGADVFHMDDAIADTKRAMMASARKSCLLVNHQRFGHTALHRLAGVEEFDHIITDAAPASVHVNALKDMAVPLTIARAEDSGA